MWRRVSCEQLLHKSQSILSPRRNPKRWSAVNKLRERKGGRAPVAPVPASRVARERGQQRRQRERRGSEDAGRFVAPGVPSSLSPSLLSLPSRSRLRTVHGRRASFFFSLLLELAPSGRKGIRFLFRNPAAEPLQFGPSSEDSSG